uniref:Uncharacterized protein n=1 Tax=Oryza glumipatula TaxID=40148 RepID=A0A0D9ZA82_9ORYZ
MAVDGGGCSLQGRAPAWPPATSSRRGVAMDGRGRSLQRRAPTRRDAMHGQRRMWPPVTSPAWRVAAEDATTSNKPGVGVVAKDVAPATTSDVGRGRQRTQPPATTFDVRRGWRRTQPPATTSDMGRGGYHLISRKYHPIRGRNRLIPDRYHMIPHEYHLIRGRNRLMHDRYHLIPTLSDSTPLQYVPSASGGCGHDTVRNEIEAPLTVAATADTTR